MTGNPPKPNPTQIRELRETVRQCYTINCAPFKNKVVFNADKTYYVEVLSEYELELMYRTVVIGEILGAQVNTTHVRINLNDPNDVLWLMNNGLVEPLINALKERMKLLEEIKNALNG
mgnify:CR=1 FL=1